MATIVFAQATKPHTYINVQLITNHFTEQEKAICIDVGNDSIPVSIA